jgi:hypothetical protein
MITQQQANTIRERQTALQAWLGERLSYRLDELPANIIPPTNEERSALEVFEFCRDKPDNYFLYISNDQQYATTWTGEKLGTVVQTSKPWRDNFNGTRVHIRISAINGAVYSGTYYKSAGEYARVKRVRT